MDDKLLLLGLLRSQQMHGYQLFEFIERNLGTCTDLKKPTAYHLLSKMAQDGWVEERPEQEGNRPPRKVYRLTQAGEAAFQELLRDNLGRYQASHFPGDIGIAFLDELPVAEQRALLAQRRTALEQIVERLQRAPLHAGAFQYLIDHQRRFLAFELDWIDHLLEELGS